MRCRRGGELRLCARNLEIDASYASMMPGTEAGPYVILEVGDTGSGIAPEIIERIFDPFFTTKPLGQGTGLGLSTVLGIVKSHGGHVSVSSDPGKGTNFQVYLPAIAVHDKIPGTFQSDSDSDPAKGHGQTILVVDDEDAVRGTVRNVLHAQGYRVLQAADGTEALAVFAKHSSEIAVVLTDLMMPFMNGVALIRALRAMSPETPIIASTGLGKKAQFAELDSMNIKTILNKPYRAKALLHAINEALHPSATPPSS